MRFILITMMTDQDSKSDGFCRSLMNCLLHEHASFAPQFLDYFEPIRKAIPPNHDDVIELIKRDDVIWKRKKPDSQGGLYHNLPGRAAASIYLTVKYKKDICIDGLFEDLIRVTGSKYGYVHLCTEAEQLAIEEDSHILGEFFSIAADIPIKQKGFNSLGWKNYFSKQYAQRIDLDGLAKAGFFIEVVDDGLFIQISEKMTDVIDNLHLFLARRKTAKSYFDESFFRKPAPIY